MQDSLEVWAKRDTGIEVGKQSDLPIHLFSPHPSLQTVWMEPIKLGQGSIEAEAAQYLRETSADDYFCDLWLFDKAQCCPALLLRTKTGSG